MITVRPSTSMPGIARGTEPAQMIVARPRRVSPPSTDTAPSAVSRPNPSTTVTLRRLRSPDSPLWSWPTMPALRLLAAGQSGSGSTPAGSFTPCAPACLTVRNTSAACSRALAGMQPRCRQVPPTFSFSTIATLSPADAAYSAAAYPPGPPPSTTRSKSLAHPAVRGIRPGSDFRQAARATFRSVSAISAGCGITASSSGGLVGVGVLRAAIRTTGWSRCQKASSWMVAAISAP